MTARGPAVVLLASLVGMGMGVGLGGAGCGDSKEDAPPPPPAPVVDAGPLPVTPPAPGITELPTYDPASGHLDGKERDPQPPPARPRNRNARMLGIMLRSTPPGAIAAVDGQPIGPTPTYWEGEFTGSEREFTFALAKHAVARYRFVPTTNGVVHGRLEPIADRPGAGTPAIPRPAYPALEPRVPLGAAAPVTSGSGPVTSGSAPVTSGSAPVTAPEDDEPTVSPTVTPTTAPALDGGAASSAPSATAAPTTAPTGTPTAAPTTAPSSSTVSPASAP